MTDSVAVEVASISSRYVKAKKYLISGHSIRDEVEIGGSIFLVLALIAGIGAAVLVY
jgi:hypothetical protein